MEFRPNYPYSVYEGGLFFGDYKTKYKEVYLCKFMPEEKVIEKDYWCWQWKEKES